MPDGQNVTEETVETSVNARPEWLLGTWWPAGECGAQDSFHIRFNEDGTFETADMSGTYRVDGEIIQLENLNGPEEAVKELGGSAAIEYGRDPSSGNVSFTGNRVERCGGE